MKRTTTYVAAGLIAGAVLVGVPGYAAAHQTTGSDERSSHLGQMMSDPERRADMTAMMKDMMRDPEMRKQMKGMMSESWNRMSGSEDGTMPMQGMSRR
jgi:hypothetical protein